MRLAQVLTQFISRSLDAWPVAPKACSVVIHFELFTQRIPRSKSSRVFRAISKREVHSIAYPLLHCEWRKRQVNKPNATMPLAVRLSNTKSYWQLTGFHCSLLLLCLVTPCRKSHKRFVSSSLSFLRCIMAEASTAIVYKYPRSSTAGLPSWWRYLSLR